MIGRRRAHLERRSREQYALRRFRLRRCLAPEALSATELRAPHVSVGTELMRGDHEVRLVTLHEISGARSKPVTNVCDGARNRITARRNRP